MKLLRSASITGLWGSKTLTATFFPDANFLIGPNGSGKTTVINLIAAVLTADLPTLNRIVFEQIQLRLRDYEKGDESVIVVSRVTDRSRRFASVNYRFEDGKGPRDYSAEDVERLALRRFPRRVQSAILEELGTVAKVQWLSIHRSPPKAQDEDDDESYDQQWIGNSSS